MPSEETPENLDAPVDETVEATETPAEAHAEHDELGEGGRKALEAERKARRAAERAAKAAAAEIEKLKEAQLDETERALAQARREARDEALAEVNARVLKAEVKAIATGKLNDPTDALTFIDMSDFEVSEDGNVDTKAIAKAIDELVKTKPYLAAQRVGGDVDGGARGKPTTSSGDMNALIRRAAGLA